MSFLNDVATALTSAGVAGGASGWGLYIGHLPPSPDRALAIYNTGGDQPETRLAIDYPTFQIRGRGAKSDYSVLHTKMRAVLSALHAGEGDVGASYVYVYAVQSEPLDIGRDVNDRPEMTLNFRSMKDR